MSRSAEVVIDLVALKANFAHVCALAPHSKIMAIIKADAYGHGLIPVAQALQSANAFGVACLEEAKKLRSAHMGQRIVLLHGHYSVAELTEISTMGMDIIVHNIDQIKMLEQTPLNQPVSVWLKIDTGMHRLGFSTECVMQIFNQLQQLDNVQDIRCMTHLASAHLRRSTMTTEQMQCFCNVIKALDVEKTIANSAAIMAFPESHVDWVRPGIMLYGVSPFHGQHGLQEGLQPVMTLQAKLIAVKEIKAGGSVGYGAAWVCPESMRIGVVAIGYGDGYPRYAGVGTPVLVNGKRVQLIGNVSMDMLTVDLRSQPDTKTGDTVTLWGKGLPVEEVSDYIGTIPYALLSAVNQQLQFRYI